MRVAGTGASTSAPGGSAPGGPAAILSPAPGHGKRTARPREPRSDVVLVGGGHAHLLVARDGDALRRTGARLTLVDPGDFRYSGLATGVLAGAHPRDGERVDLDAFCRRLGVRRVRDRAVGLDPDARRLELASGRSLPYAALSFNVGSEVRTGGLAVRAHPGVYPVKPIGSLLRLRRDLVAWPVGDGPFRVVVVGGGATGCEVAAAVDGLAGRLDRTAEVTLLPRADRILPRAPSGAARSLRQRLERRGIRVRTGREAIHAGPDGLRLRDGGALAADAVVLATGLRPPAGLSRLELPLGPREGVHVDATLRAVGRERVFAVGDCADLEGHSLPRLGVFAVREAPVLAENLAAVVAGGSLRRYEPQARWLSILHLGDGRGLATWGPFWWRGRASLWLKDYLDARFLRKLRAVEAPDPRAG